LLIGVVAPATSEESFLNKSGQDVLDAMVAWFGNPVAVE